MKYTIYCLITICIISILSIPFLSEAQSTNIVNNPGFDEGLASWTSFGTGVKQVVNLEGNNILLINNTDGSNIGIVQTITLPEPKLTPFKVKYRIKPMEVPDGTLVSLDLYVLYPNKSIEVIITPFRVYSRDVGMWHEKEFIVDPFKPIEGFRVYLLNYNYNVSNFSSAYYDDISIVEMETQEIPVKNNIAEMVLTKYGQIKYLNYNGKNHLTSVQPFSVVGLDNGTYFDSNRIEQIGEGVYRIGYLNYPLEVDIRIIPRENYFLFQPIEYHGPVEDIDSIEYKFYANRSQAYSDWAFNAGEDELFFNVLPLTESLYCRKTTYYGCFYSRWLGLSGEDSFVFVTSPKKDYFDSIENALTENNVKKSVLADGKWLWNSENFRDSYLFFSMTSSNYKQMLEYAKRGNFRQVLLTQPILYGYYNKSRPSYFKTTEEFFAAVDEFREEGINTGVHTFANRIESSDDIINFSNPSMKLSDALFGLDVGNTSKEIGISSGEIEFSFQLSGVDAIRDYFGRFDTLYVERNYRKYFLVENEIVECSGYSGNKLVGCTRGLFNTVPRIHPSGSEVRYLIYDSNFFINPQNKELLDISTGSFAAFLKRIGATMVYYDGTTFFIPIEIEKTYLYHAYQAKYGFYPYVEKMDRVPLFQFGSSSPPKNYYLGARVATWDGVTYKNKQFTKEYKTVRVLTNNPYYDILKEFGWWKFFGAFFSSEGSATDRAGDIDSTTFDEVHYVMTKVLATETLIGLQMSTRYMEHARLGELFDLMGLYHKLIYEDRKSGIVPKNIKEYLKDPEKEAELNYISGYNLVEKKVIQNYCSYEESACSFEAENPFGNQKLKLEIRPRFDYYPYEDSRHKTIYDFSTQSSPRPSQLPVRTSGQDVSCMVSDDGTVSISNDGAKIGGCVISIPQKFDMAFKRGIGISMEGNSNNELVVLRVEDIKQYGIRDYKLMNDFSGKKELMLGDPTGSFYDYIDGVIVDWMDKTAINRHWGYYFWHNECELKIYINVKPKTTSSLKLYSVKALYEKGNSTLVNPRIKVNGKEIIFNLNLTVDDTNPYLLDYNGFNKTYNLYNSNQKLLSSGTLASDEITLNNGINKIEFSSDLSNPLYSSRADIRVSVYDDEDGDSIPTNGDFSEENTPCNGGNNFCDDNCPTTPNPDQKDSDNDGVGDACDSDYCGNSVCSPEESCSSCPQDCGECGSTAPPPSGNPTPPTKPPTTESNKTCTDGGKTHKHGERISCGSSIGECRQGTQSCINGQWGSCTGQLGPSEEICDGLDNNCNGQTDENCLCVEGQNKPCGSNIGICKQGVQSCVDGQWGACIGNTPPLTEDICFNYLDDNCNGEVDEGCGEAFNTCNNGKLDEGEQGIDCGGKCPKKCPDLELISVLMVLVGLFGMIGTTVYFGYIK